MGREEGTSTKPPKIPGSPDACRGSLSQQSPNFLFSNNYGASIKMSHNAIKDFLFKKGKGWEKDTLHDLVYRALKQNQSPTILTVESL